MTHQCGFASFSFLTSLTSVSQPTSNERMHIKFKVSTNEGFLNLVHFKCMLRKLLQFSAGVNYGRSYSKGGECGGACASGLHAF